MLTRGSRREVIVAPPVVTYSRCVRGRLSMRLAGVFPFLDDSFFGRSVKYEHHTSELRPPSMTYSTRLSQISRQ